MLCLQGGCGWGLIVGGALLWVEPYFVGGALLWVGPYCCTAGFKRGGTDEVSKLRDIILKQRDQNQLKLVHAPCVRTYLW